MINQQLLNYIQGQLASGFPKEGIKRELTVQGWTEQDMNECFFLLENPSVVPITSAIPVSNSAYIQTPNIAQTNIPSYNDSMSNSPLDIGKKNKIWSKVIPIANITFMAVSLLLVFGLDLIILIAEPELFGFYAAMLVVISIFARFFYFENYVFKKRFLLSSSKLDRWFFGLVILRNLVFLLNFIPVIQIGGGISLVFGGIPYIIIYYIILRKRSASV